MRSSDFFDEELGGSDNDWMTVQVFKEQLVNQLRQGPIEQAGDLDAAVGMLDLVQNDLEAYGTGGGEKLQNPQMVLAIRTLESVCRRLGIAFELPFRDFGTFRSYWIRQGASGGGGWQARRDLIEDLLGPTRQKLHKLEEQPLKAHLDEDAIAKLRDPAAIQEQLGRIQRAIMDDPALAIGSAKELVESTAKVVLLERGLPVNDKDDMPALVAQAQLALGLHPSSADAGPDGTDAVKKILGGVMTVTTGLAELRNRGYGTGHGASGVRVGLRARHAHLAVNAAITWCQLMLDTLADPEAPWRKAAP
jgi:abortive infection Abi-like protein